MEIPESVYEKAAKAMWESSKRLSAKCRWDDLDGRARDEGLRRAGATVDAALSELGLTEQLDVAYDKEGQPALNRTEWRERLCDVTFPTDPALLDGAREYHTKMPILPLEHWGYWGVEFDPTFVRAYWTKFNEYGAEGEGHVGILDRPPQDALDGENMSEWRDEWPIYGYPYDVKRTEP